MQGFTLPPFAIKIKKRTEDDMSFVRMVYCEKIVCSGMDAGGVVRSVSFTPRAKSVLTQQKNIYAERLGTDVREWCMKSAAGIDVCDIYIPPAVRVMA